jgi:hypothetical protein
MFIHEDNYLINLSKYFALSFQNKIHFVFDVASVEYF